MLNRSGLAATTAVGVLLAISSTATLGRYAGWLAAGLYLATAPAILFFAARLSQEGRLARFEGKAAVAFWLALACASAGFLFIRDAFDPSMPGVGSDRDDSIRMGASALLHGEYPYRDFTYNGNDMTSLPGALILAVPAELLGDASLQNFVWLGIAFVLGSRWLGSRATAAFWLAVALGLTPIIWVDLVTGGDLMANALYVFIFGGLLAASAHRNDVWPWLSALVFGVALASRLNFLLLVPPLWILIAQRTGFPQATRLLAVSGVAFACLVAPLLLDQPGESDPLRGQGKFPTEFGPIPHADAIVMLAVGSLALAPLLGWRQWSLQALLAHASAIQAIWPALLVAAVWGLADGRDNLFYVREGYFVPALVIAFIWLAWTTRPGARPNPTQSSIPTGI